MIAIANIAPGHDSRERTKAKSGMFAKPSNLAELQQFFAPFTAGVLAAGHASVFALSADTLDVLIFFVETQAKAGDEGWHAHSARTRAPPFPERAPPPP